MSSPLKCEEGLSMIEGEKLSPIKISANDVSRSTKSPSPPPPLPVIAKHPHGLTAKRQARRNTINDTMHKGLVNTPLKKGGETMSAVKRKFPFTSPLMRDISPNLKKQNNKTDSSKAKPQALRSSPSNKENELALVKMDEGDAKDESWSRIPSNFGSSPSMVAIHESFNAKEKDTSIRESTFVRKGQNSNIGSDDSRKIAKVITNANDSLSHFLDNDYSVQVDDVFNREDLVVKISSGISPLKPKGSDTAQVDSENESSTHNRDTDAEREDPAHPAEGQSQTEQSGKSIGGYVNDYGESHNSPGADAKSPETNQHTGSPEAVTENQTWNKKSSPLKDFGMSDDKEASYKLDDSSDERDLEEEPTMNFLSSPNSKPVFSLIQVQSMQNEHYRELESLDELLNQKNHEILKLSEELSATNNKFLIFDQKINDLKLSKKKLEDSECLLYAQVEHSRRQQAITNKNLKIKEKKLDRLNAVLEYESRKNESARISSDELGKENTQLREEIHTLENERASFRGDINKLEYQIHQLKEELSMKDKDIKYLTETNLDFNMKNETLLKEKESLLHDIDHLTHENNGLEEINTKQQELLEELDKLETLAKDKISNLELTLDSKVHELKESSDKKDELLHSLKDAETRANNLQSRLEDSDNKIKEITGLVNSNTQAQKEFDAEINRLQEELDTSNQSNAAIATKIENSQMEVDNLIRKLEEANEKQYSLATTNAEKDEIISGDTKKMDELVEKINHQKQTIADYEGRLKNSPEASSTDNKTNESLIREIEDLKSQVEQGHAKTNARIQEVAEQLYFEYSKKHEMKVDQVRASFKKQIDKLNFEKKAQARDIESLHKKLDTVNMEKEQLIQLIDDYRAVSDPTFKKKLSPKKSGFKKPKV